MEQRTKPQPKPVELAQAVAAFEHANRHAAQAIGHQRSGDHALAWEHGAYSRFFRTAALGFMNGHGRGGAA